MTQEATPAPDSASAALLASERQHEIAEELLRLANESCNTRELIQAAVRFFHQQSGCEAVGVRLRDGDDYPYFEVRGFPPEFVLLENHLCARDAAGELVRDSLGNPVLECMCGNVICGRFDPAKPFFTRQGSFWSNCTTELLASTTEADRQARTRNRCNGEGYESVALIPLRVGNERLGLLQLNDHRKGMFTADAITLWERFAGYLAVALSKFRADEALRESELRLRRIVEHTAAGYFFLDREGRFQDVNEAWLKMHGIASREEIVGRHFSVTQPEADIAAAEQTVNALMEGRPVPTGESSRRCADGSLAYHTFTAQPVLRGESVIGAEGFLIDITDRRRVEESLRRERDCTRSYLDTVEAVVVALDCEGRITLINRKGCRLLGYDEVELLGRPWFTACLRQLDGMEKVYPNFLRIVSGDLEAVEYFENPVVTRSGELRQMAWHNALLRDDQNQIVGTLSAGEDVTEQRQAEDLLRESELRLRQTAEAGNVGLWDWDLRTNRVHYSAGWKRQIGYEDHEITDDFSEWQSRVHPDDLEATSAKVRVFVEQPWPNYQAEFRFRHKDGSYRWILAQASLLNGDDGAPWRMLGSHVDITDRKQAEEALRTSEAAHRSLVQAMPDVVTRFDRDGRHLFVSDNVGEVAGIPPEQFLGRTHRELGFPRRLCDFREDAIRRVFDGGAAHETEFSVDGERGSTTFNWRLVPECDAQGKIQSVLSVARDITAHREAERNYQTLFQEMLDGFALHEIICDAQGEPVDYRFLAVNPAFERMTGLTAEAAVGKTVRDILPDIEPHWIETYGRVALTGEPACFENYAAGLGKHFQVTAFRPTPNQFACIFVDITQRKRAETALLESQTELQAIYDNAPVMMCVLNANREVQYVNRALAAFVGKPQTELVHDRACGILGCINALDDPRGCGFGPNCGQCPLRLAMLDTMRTGKSRTGIEYHATLLLDQTSREVTLLGSTARIRSAGQDMLLLCLADITDRKRAEEQRLRLEAQVLHAQKLESLGVLAGGIAHDFNNLLGAIVSNADLAKQQLPPDAPAQLCIDRSLRAAARAADLTRQMLTYSGKGHFLVRKINLNDLVKENTYLLQASIAKEAELRLDLCAAIPPVEADPGQLQQVIMNLITNAAEALGERPGTVSLCTGVTHCDEAALAAGRTADKPPAGEFIFLEVSDSRCGMDAETRQRLFDPFFSTKFTGRGLGMSAVLGIVRGHRGTIFVDSEVGAGTTIRVLFPAAVPGSLAAGEEPSPAPPRDAPSPPSFSGTVLMVDDDEMARMACQAVLTSFGFEVLVAADGEAAVRIFREHADAIRCVVLDLTMPKMDGLAAFNAMRSIKPDVKVVLVSGYDESEATRRFGGGGLASFVQKPYRLHALAAEIRRVLQADCTPHAPREGPSRGA